LLVGRHFSFLPKDVVITAAKRTPIGSFMGSLSTVPAVQLGAQAIKAALSQSNIKPSDVNEVILGQIVAAGTGQNPARQAATYAGLPDNVITFSLNKMCASGLKSVVLGAQSIALGQADVVVAGGMENMSLAPFLLPNYRSGQMMGDSVVVDSMTHDGLFCPFNKKMMGACAERTAEKYDVKREEQDVYCRRSYERAAEAWKRGFFKKEVEPFEVKTKKGTTIVDIDEEYTKVKFDKISSLKPVFEKEGTITAANASSINDGAGALVLMSAEKAKSVGAKPLARIRSFADAETEPMHFGIAPSQSITKALNLGGVTKDQVDLYEVNEAFSAIVLANMKALELDPEKVNVNGGAVALGHPVGASGARILSTLIYALQESNKSLGMTGICNGGGGSTSVLIELL